MHLIGGAARLPDMFSVPRLALASTAHVYPEIVSGQAVTGVVERVVPGILERLRPSSAPLPEVVHEPGASGASTAV